MSGNWTSETSCRGLINDNLCGIANRPAHPWFFIGFGFKLIGAVSYTYECCSFPFCNKKLHRSTRTVNRWVGLHLCLSAALVATATMRCPCVIVDEPDYDTRHSGNDDTWYLTFILVSLISLKRWYSVWRVKIHLFYSVIIFAPCKRIVYDFLLVMFCLQNCWRGRWYWYC